MQSEFSTKVKFSPNFIPWLIEQNISLAFSSYQAGKLFLIGHNLDGTACIEHENFGRCMGLWATNSTLYLSSENQIFCFEDVLENQQQHDGYDCLWLPQAAYFTGGLDIHDLTVDDNEKLLFINTLFSCLATTTSHHSFVPVWQPPWISQLVPEDRCHLNGLAIREGKPRYVTACSQTDKETGWRDKRRDGGCILDISNNEIIVQGLSMPHSPRWYQDKLWVHNSGCGQFGYVDFKQGKFVPIFLAPSYLRGLAFCEDWAIIGMSKLRDEVNLSPLPFQKMRQNQDIKSICGVIVIELKTGAIAHWLAFKDCIDELYDIVVLPGVNRPKAIGFKGEEIKTIIKVG